jgi:hypothetical protein
MKNGELLRRRLYPLVWFQGKSNVRIQGNFRGPFEYTLSQEEQSCGVGEIEVITLGWLNGKFMINRYSHQRTLLFYKIDFLGSTD